MKRILAAVAATLSLTAVTVFAQAPAGKPVRVGVALSQSGNLADSAKLYFQGVELWKDQEIGRAHV